MKAARIHEYGPPSVFRVEDVPDPKPGPKDVLIRIHASAVNPVDWKIRSGGQRGAIRYKLPWILGLDLSGEVVEVGAQVRRFQPGDQVWSSPSHRRPGCYAELIAVAEAEVGKKPASISHLEAAGIPLVGLTAWQCVVDAARLQAGQRALIQAGSGGVGSFAIQLCKHLGAHVITTCSERNAELVRGLGADEVIDYRSTNWWERVSELDFVLDSLGGEDRKRALAAVRRGGCVANITANLPKLTARYGPTGGLLVTGLGLVGFKLKGLARGVRARMVVKKCRGDQLDQIAELVDAGAIKPLLDKTFPLEQIADAHAYSETGRARGKIAIAISAEARQASD